MMKLLKSFTFWFLILGIFAIWEHQIGRDSKSILLISFNPILNSISHNDVGRTFMNSGPIVSCKTIIGNISIYWYIASFLTHVVTGIFLDTLCYIYRKLKHRTHTNE